VQRTALLLARVVDQEDLGRLDGRGHAGGGDDAVAQVETMLSRMWTAESEKAVTAALIDEYAAAAATAKGPEKVEMQTQTLTLTLTLALALALNLALTLTLTLTLALTLTLLLALP